MKRTSIVFAASVFIFLLTSGNVWAQATAQISGTVADQSGAVLPGVEITVTQSDTGMLSVSRNDSSSEPRPSISRIVSGREFPTRSRTATLSARSELLSIRESCNSR